MVNRETLQQNLIESIKRFDTRLNYLKSKSKNYSWIRLSVFLTSLILFLFFFFSSNTNLLVITAALFLISFGILTGIHNKLENGIKRNILWTRIKKSHLSRMNLIWKDLPSAVFQPDEHHPFDFDLSITGEYSLHRLMNTAASAEGSRILKQWLTDTQPDPVSTLNRQALIKELILLHRFRDKLSLFSHLISKKELSGTKISEWINTPSFSGQIKKVLALLWSLIPINVLLFLLFIFNIIPAYFFYSLLIYVAVYWVNAKYNKGIFEDLLEIKEEFGKFSVIFEFLEKYPYKQNSKIKFHCQAYLNHKPSSSFNIIKNTADAVSYTRNPLVGLLLNVIFPYNFYFAYKLEKLKSALKSDLPVWLDKWYSLEAYNSLATYAYLNPQCTFPQIISDGRQFSASDIGHPLIHPDNVVYNTFEFNSIGAVFIITGSNMSGKSTFLKSLGINLAMAYAGGVVMAGNFSVSPFRLYCCIKISDSVIDGISYFYAEVKRLKMILDELENNKNKPVFYLVDEIFKGTNNIERLKGSRSYIKKTVKLNGSGIISTHDLELSKLELEISSVKNFHFREETSGNKMIFDYKLHLGPSPTTNALKIMKSEGLPVED